MIVEKLALLATDNQGPLLVSPHVHGTCNLGVSAEGVYISTTTLRFQKPAEPLPGFIHPLVFFISAEPNRERDQQQEESSLITRNASLNLGLRNSKFFKGFLKPTNRMVWNYQA